VQFNRFGPILGTSGHKWRGLFSVDYLSHSLVLSSQLNKGSAVAIKCPKCQSENAEASLFCSDCGTKLEGAGEFSLFQTETLQTSLKELSTGSTFASRYQIIEELGKGGMGKVYKVFDQEVQAKIALKLIKPEVSADKNTIDRFRNELKIARDISHKNICRMYDLGREAGNYFITMEYVSGEDLKSFIRRSRQLVVGTAIFIAKQICEGLAEAHRAGVVHRDLKPGNIMIDREGNAKIMDFGIARSISVKGITGAGVMIGTPEYMSPEQVEGKEVDKRSDIYSLGIVLYEMLTGQVPFEGDTPFTIGVKQKSEIPKDPRGLNAQIPQDLSRLILRCLEKEKESRYQNADELKANLEKIEKGIPTADRPVPKRKTVTSKPITLTISRKKFFVPLSILVAIAIIGIGLWRFLPKHQIAPPPSSDKPSLAIMYFENNTGNESLDHWRKGISDLLITDLTQSKYLRVLGGDRLFNILSQLNQLEAKSYSSDILREVTVRGRVNHIVRGNFSKAGDIIRIDIVLQEANTGEPETSERVEGKGEESIFSMVDELTRRIKANFKLSAEEMAADSDKDVEKITTSSPEAYKYYLEGDRYDNILGDTRKAIQFYEKAVAIDPGFATGYLALSIAYWKLGIRSKEIEYLKKAFELKEKVSDRERYLIEAEYYSQSEKTYDQAINAFRSLLEISPDDTWGNNDLGWLYLHIEEWDKAIERFEVNIKNRDPSFTSYQMKADSYCAKGLYDKAKEVIENYLHNFPDSAAIRLFLARCHFREGKLDLALIEINKALSISPISPYLIDFKADLLMCTGDLINAEKECQKLVRTEEPDSYMKGLFRSAQLRLLKGQYSEAINLVREFLRFGAKNGITGNRSFVHQILAYMYWKSGHFALSLEELNEAWKTAVEREDLNSQRETLYYQGLVNLEMKAISRAEKIRNDLGKLVEQGLNKKHIRYYYHLAGLIELEKENFPQSIDYIEKALTFDLHGFQKAAMFVDSLALAYYKSGDLDKALKEYERIAELTTGRSVGGDIYAKSFYLRGKIYEKKGMRDKAADGYRKFLDLWKDADPGTPEVEDARERLAGLREMADK